MLMHVCLVWQFAANGWAQGYPAIAETIPGYELAGWYGIMVPAKTPAEIIAAIHKAALAALKNPRVSQSMTDLGYVSIGDQPRELTAHIKSEIERLGKIVKRTGLTVE